MPVRPRARTHMRQYKGALVLLIALQKGKSRGKKRKMEKRRGGRKKRLRMTCKTQLRLAGTPKCIRHNTNPTRGPRLYSKTAKNTCTGLTIGANQNNSTADMPNAQAHNTTQRTSLALNR